MQVQQGRDEVTLDFPVDDTGADREDALVGMSFHVPKDATHFAGDDETPSTKVNALERLDNLMLRWCCPRSCSNGWALQCRAVYAYPTVKYLSVLIMVSAAQLLRFSLYGKVE